MSADPVQRLILVPLSASAWRLCDSSVSSSDAAHLLAYIEAVADGGFEVTWVYGGRGTATYATTEAVLRVAVRRVAAAAPRRVKPKPIAHRPPLAAM